MTPSEADLSCYYTVKLSQKLYAEFKQRPYMFFLLLFKECPVVWSDLGLGNSGRYHDFIMDSQTLSVELLSAKTLTVISKVSIGPQYDN